MAKMTRQEQYKAYVAQWKQAGPELERIHNEELRQHAYNAGEADTLLAMGDAYDGPPRLTSGLVEMQKWFMKLARQQGLLPNAVKEDSVPYLTKKPRKRKR